MKSGDGLSFELEFRLEPPPYLSPERNAATEWLNEQHCGSTAAPAAGKQSPEHGAAAWRFCAHHRGLFAVRLQKDGSLVPERLFLGGKEYVLVPNAPEGS